MEIREGLRDSDEYFARVSPLRNFIVGNGRQLKRPDQDPRKDEVIFSNKSESYCIAFVDIVGSTQITSKLYNSGKIKKFYAVFINEIANIVKHHEGKVLKTVGDGVIFFFPETAKVENIEGFRQAIECLVDMTSSRYIINAKLDAESLPEISYRISADYGKLEVAMSGEISSSYDLFGPTINFCAKINKITPSNSIAIGADLWTILSSFPKLSKNYRFHEVKELSWKQNRYSYPVYLLRSSADTYTSKNMILTGTNDGPTNEIDSTHRELRIMLIEDDPSISSLFTEYLKSAGMIVDSFTNPENALAHFMESDYHYYDIIVTDIRMPRLNGFELYQQLKSVDPNIRIIFVTALDIGREIFTLLPDLKPSQFLIKPINPNVLINSVRQHVKKHSERG